MIIVIQYLAPSHLPIAAEGGCSNTNVMENRETAAFRSSGVAPMSVVNPVHNFVTIDVMINKPPRRSKHTLRLCISNVGSI